MSRNASGFWKGVLQNALGGFLAGLLLMMVGKFYADHWLGPVMGQFKAGFGHIAAIQAQVDQMGRQMQQQNAPAKKGASH